MTTAAHCAIASGNSSAPNWGYTVPATDFNVDPTSIAGQSFAFGSLNVSDLKMSLGVKSFIERVGGAALKDSKRRNWLMTSVYAPSTTNLSALLTKASRETAVGQITSLTGGATPVAFINRSQIPVPGISIVIDSDGGFFNRGNQGTSAYQKAFYILHEIAHLAEVHTFVQNDGQGDPATVAAAQAKNNAEVMANCGSAIATFSRTKEW